MTTPLRNRATAVVMRDGKVLLVKGSGKFAMPGGGIDDGELQIVAAARELWEETGLEPKRIEYLFTWESDIHRHEVFRVEAEGDVEIAPGEITDFLWWDREDDLPTYGHVETILKRL